MISNSSYCQRLAVLLGSAPFFWGIVVLLVLQAAWIALSSLYPMAFDEEVHLGLIRLYAHHLSPFWDSQPAGADSFGAVVRDPSYLYHYVMSFPYRLIAAVTSSETAQVLSLRALNIGLFAAGLEIYRRLLLKTGASRAVVHLCVLLFVLVPVVPLLAGQINYDNAFIPLTGLLLLLTINFSQQLQDKKQINVRLLLGILILGLVLSLVKYAGLPIFAMVVLYLIVRLWQVYRSPVTVWRNLAISWRHGKRPAAVGLVLLVIVMGGLFVERYGYNLVRYHTPVAACDQVLSERQCSAYGPWNRDHNLALHKGDTSGQNPADFMGAWLKGMWRRMFFVLAGPTVGYQTREPFPVPAIAAIVFAGLSAVVVPLYARRLFARYNRLALSLLLAVSLFYVAVLWMDGYETYTRTGKAVAINGRYLFPVLPILFLFSALAFGQLLERRLRLKLLLAGTALCCLLCGGGAMTYSLRSNDSWYWHSPAVPAANHAVQRVIGPLIPGYQEQASGAPL